MIIEQPRVTSVVPKFLIHNETATVKVSGKWQANHLLSIDPTFQPTVKVTFKDG